MSVSTATYNTEAEGFASFIAGEALEANRCVKYDSTEGQVVYSGAITDIVIGVTTQKVASGEQVIVQTKGVAKIATTAAAVSLGAEVMPDSSTGGRILTAAGATARSVGVAASAGGGTTAGELIRVRLNIPNLKGPPNS